MLELTAEQIEAVEKSDDAPPPRLVNPRTREAFVLLRADEYERLKDEAYDDSPWTRAEIEAATAETRQRSGLDTADGGDDVYDRIGEKS